MLSRADVLNETYFCVLCAFIPLTLDEEGEYYSAVSSKSPGGSEERLQRVEASTKCTKC